VIACHHPLFIVLKKVSKKGRQQRGALVIAFSTRGHRPKKETKKKKG